MNDHIIIDKNDAVLKITLNRPEKKNALSNEMYEQICRGLITANDDPQIRVVLIRSSSENFTSGNDLADFAAVNQGKMDLRELPVVKLIKLVVGFDKPLVCAVSGLAVGIGTTLLFHCDSVIAGKSSIFHMPFVSLGLVPEFASSYLFPAIAGRTRASHYLLLGEAFGINEAREMGIVSQVCDDDAVNKTALSVCQKLAALPPATVRAVKRLITPSEQQAHLQKVIERESAVFAKCLTSAEHREALAAFFEKRKPDFSRFE